ncbi:hypothetical protein ACQ4PT_069129 [Festuca glaucescens]
MEQQAQEQEQLTPQQQQQAMVTELFEGVDFVRLRSGRAYVHAAEDGRSVCLDPRSASHNAVWAVRRHFCGTTARMCVLLRGAYGRYLRAPDATAGCSFSSPCRAAATSRQGVFRLCDASERYLRANPRCLLPCRRGVSVSASACLGKAIQWVLEPVPRGGRPELPRPRDSLWGKLFAHVPLSGLCMRWFSEREIRWIRAEESGVFSQDNWASTRFTGRHTILLETQLVKLLPPHICPRYTLCVRAGLHGQPTPLAIDLPRSREPLDVVLFWYTVTVLNIEIVDNVVFCPFSAYLCLF